MRSTLTEKQQFWFEHVRACDQSDKSMRAYAEANGLKVAEFYSWKAVLRRKGVVGKDEAAAAHLFRKADIVDGRYPGHCRVTLPTGVALDIEAGTEPTWVTRLVLALSRQ